MEGRTEVDWLSQTSGSDSLKQAEERQESGSSLRKDRQPQDSSTQESNQWLYLERRS